MKKRLGRGGYLYYDLIDPFKVKFRISVHRLVATTFIYENYGCGQVVNHKDGNKHNNHILNLEWVTPSQNSKHSYQIGKSYISKKARQLASIRFGKCVIDLETGIYYNSIREAALCNNIPEGTLRKKILGTRPSQNRFKLI